MDRRSLLGGLVLAGATPLILAQSGRTAAAATTATMPDLASVKMAPDFYAGVLWRAELSLATSQIAVGAVQNKNAKEFAGFELGEAITVNAVLKDLGATASAMDAAAMAKLEKIKAAKGAELDAAYIALQLKNHEQLCDLADAYLHNSAGATDPAEKEGRHLGMLTLAVFKEHVAICTRILGELKA